MTIRFSRRPGRSAGFAPLLSALLLSAAGGAALRAQAPEPPVVNPLTGQAVEQPAVDPLEGRPIAAIRIKGAYRVGRDLLLGMIGLRVGDPYRAAAVRENFESLLKRDIFEEMTIEAEDSRDGVVLTYTVRELPILHDVVIDGVKTMTQGQALDRLKENRLELQKGVAIDYERAKRVEEGLRMMLGSAGLEGAEVRMRLDPLPSGEVNLVYTVTEGAPTRLRNLTILGENFYEERELRGSMKDLQRHWLFSRLSSKNKFSRGRLEQGLEKWREMYESQGFIDVDFGEPEITPAGEVLRKRRWWYTRKRKARAGTVKTRYVDVTVRMTEGERYKLGELQWDGNALYSDDELKKMFPGHRPSPWADKPVLKYIDPVVGPVRRLIYPDRALEGRWLNRPLMKNLGKGIEAKYGEKGYIFANANLTLKRRAERDADGAPVADAEYQIGEDRQYRLRRLEFDGNDKTYDRILRREVPVNEGDIFNNGKYQTGLFKINQLSLLEITEQPVIDKLPDEPGWVKVTVSGKEARHDELQVGGGYSGVSGGVFNFSFATRNFGGTGKVLNVQASLGSRQTFYSGTVYEPWFLGRPIGASLTVRNNRSDYAAYTRRTKGAGVGASKPFGPFTSLRLNYDFERVSVSDFATANGALTPEQNGYDATVSSLSTSWNYDTRNNLMRATQGASFNAGLSVSGGPLGGNTNTIAPSLEWTWYYSRWRKQTLAVHLSAQMVSSFGGRKLELFQRLFTGGEFSLRAFPSNGVAPSTSEGREFIDQYRRIEGGNRMYTLNVEYVYHVAEMLDFVLFYDQGNVYHEKQAFDFNRALRDAGFELRFFIPAIQAPLRMFWAKNLTPRECVSYRICDEGTVFQFTIGQTF